MPVTAKLSRRVYEQLGDEVANALVEWFNAVDTTYKADLRELNDLNFARFEAKIGERLAELRADMERRFARFEVQMTERVAELRSEVGTRIAELRADFERRFARVDVQVAQLNARIDNCVDRATFEQRLTKLEVRLTRKIFAVSAASLLAQTAVLVALLKFFGR